MKKLTFSAKLSRLYSRLHDPEWRRYGMLLVGGKLAALALILLAIGIINPGLLGMASHAAEDPVLKAMTSSIPSILFGH